MKTETEHDTYGKTTAKTQQSKNQQKSKMLN
jgi:hypothetical protein